MRQHVLNAGGAGPLLLVRLGLLGRLGAARRRHCAQGAGGPSGELQGSKSTWPCVCVCVPWTPLLLQWTSASSAARRQRFLTCRDQGAARSARSPAEKMTQQQQQPAVSHVVEPLPGPSLQLEFPADVPVADQARCACVQNPVGRVPQHARGQHTPGRCRVCSPAGGGARVRLLRRRVSGAPGSGDRRTALAHCRPRLARERDSSATRAARPTPKLVESRGRRRPPADRPACAHRRTHSAPCCPLVCRPRLAHALHAQAGSGAAVARHAVRVTGAAVDLAEAPLKPLLRHPGDASTEPAVQLVNVSSAAAPGSSQPQVRLAASRRGVGCAGHPLPDAAAQAAAG